MEKQMLKGLGDRTTKAGRVKVITKRSQTSSGVEDTMSDLPGKIDDLTVGVEEEKFPPRSRPIKDTERRKELYDTVGGSQIFRQEVLITRLGRHPRGGGQKVR